MKNVIGGCLLFWAHIAAAQVPKTSLDFCQSAAAQFYPIAQQKDIIARVNALSINTLEKNLLPQIEFNAQATYQSEVTQLPGGAVPPLSKDQYRATLDVKQIIWDGGVIAKQRDWLKTRAALETEKVAVEMNKMTDKVNQLYFNVLQIDENIKLLNLLIAELNTRQKRVQAGIDNGIAIRTNNDALEAEKLKSEQKIIELQSQRQTVVETLALLTNQPFNAQTVFERPSEMRLANPVINPDKPELKVFDWQKKQLEQSVKMAALKRFPRLFAFASGGYGRPGYNFLRNEFDFFGIAGVSLKWNVSDLYTKNIDNELNVLKSEAQAVSLQKEAVLLNVKAAVQQAQNDIQKAEKLMATDKKIIALREKIKTVAAAQLDNGATTVNEYLTEVNAENQAKQYLVLHELQWLLAQIQLKMALGL